MKEELWYDGVESYTNLGDNVTYPTHQSQNVHTDNMKWSAID
jgi:hypothetical protein